MQQPKYSFETIGALEKLPVTDQLIDDIIETTYLCLPSELEPYNIKVFDAGDKNILHLATERRTFLANTGDYIIIYKDKLSVVTEDILQSIEREQLSTWLTPGFAAAILAVREQVEKHGFDDDHNKSNDDQELIDAALFYITGNPAEFPKLWDKQYMYKGQTKTKREQLAHSIACLIREYDRRISEDI